MKIISHGKKDLLKGIFPCTEYDPQIIRFNCGECGCVFEAEKTEYEIDYRAMYNAQLPEKEKINRMSKEEKDKLHVEIIRTIMTGKILLIYKCKCPECGSISNGNGGMLG